MRPPTKSALACGLVLLSLGGSCKLQLSAKTSAARSFPSEPAQQQASAIRVLVVTWNLAESTPSKSDCALVARMCEEADIVAMGCQEVEALKPRRSEGRGSLRFRRRLGASLGATHRCVSRESLGSTQLLIFARNGGRPIKVLQTWGVTCGVGNVLANKGSLGAVVSAQGRRLAFLTAHLAAHQVKHTRAWLTWAHEV